MKEPFFISKTFKQQVIINESSSCYKVAKFWWHAEEKRCILDRKERRLMCHILMINGRRRLHTSNVVIKQQSKATQNLSKFSLFFFFAHISYWHHFRSYYKKVGQVFYTLNTIISCDLKRLHFTFTLLLLWKVTKIVKNLIKYELLLQFHLYMW